jgi:DNA-binding MarR family transcriptional regulator
MDAMTRTAHPAGSSDPTGEFPLGPSEYLFFLAFLTTRYRDVALDPLLGQVCLSVPRWRALAAIRRIESCTMSQLSRFAGIDRTTLTRSVDHLVAEGLVDRWTPNRDRRLVKLALSQAGSELYGKAVKVMMGVSATAVAGIAEEELRQAARTLQAVLRNLIGDQHAVEELLSFGRSGPAN